jgi:hypothetical protein
VDAAIAGLHAGFSATRMTTSLLFSTWPLVLIRRGPMRPESRTLVVRTTTARSAFE